MDRDAFKALVHYICWKADPAKLGATKLNKVIWFAETRAFLESGHSMTGARFVKQDFGPVPVKITPILRELEFENKLQVSEDRVFDLSKRKFVSLSEPDIQAFSEEQLRLIDTVIDEVSDGHTATSVSNLTHDEIWDAAEFGSEIPIYAVLGKSAPLQDEDYAWIQEHTRP